MSMDTYLFPQPMVLSGISGPIVQLIQAPNGTTQLVSTSTSPGSNTTAVGNSGGQPVVSASSTKNSSVNSSRSTKQILPKPPGNSGNSQSNGGSSKSGTTVNNNGSGVNATTANNNPNINPVNQGARSLVTNMPSTVNTVGHTLTTGPLSTGPGHQILLGPPGNQKMSFINPPGTFLLNQVIPGLGSQPILIQGNINNIGGPLQLTLRQQHPHTPSVVAVSSANGNSVSVASSQGTTTTPLISALAGQTSTSVQRTTSTAPTYLFSNQGPAVSSAPTMVMASGQPGFRGQNIIFTRPPNLIGTPGSMVQGAGANVGHTGPTQTVPQLIQIQTPNGPMLVALQTTPHLGPPSGGSQMFQTHVTPSPQAVPITSTIMPLQTSGTVGNQSASTHPTLHTILQTSSAESLNQSSMGQQSGAPLTANNLIFSQSGNVISSQQSVTTSTSLTPQQQQHHQQKQSQTPHSSSTNSGRGNSKVKKESKGVNLADLLKETGILQDSSPPQSPSSITIRQTSTDTDLTHSISPQTEITQTSTLITGTTPTILDANHHHHHHSHHHHHHQPNQSQQQTMLMVPGQGNHQGSNILIAQGPGIQAGTAPQLRLSLAPDGSVILQPTNMGPGTANTILQNPSNAPGTGASIVSDLGSTTMTSINNSKFIDTLRDSCGPGSSQPSPDSTTPTLDASTPTSTAVSAISSTKSNSPAITTIGSSPVLSHKQTLMQHLNAGSTMKVGDSVTSMTITPIMGPPLRDDMKSGSSFIPLNMNSDLNVRESLTINSLKTSFKQELSIKSSSADHLTSATTTTSSSSSSSPLLSEVKTEIVTVPLNNIPSTSSSTSSSSTTTSVLTMSNCDNLGQNASMPVLLTSASLVIPEDANNKQTSINNLSTPTTITNRSGLLTPNNQSNNSTGSSSSLTSLVTPNGQSIVTPSSLPTINTGTSGGGGGSVVTSTGNQQGITPIVDQNGYQFVQISLNNQEFLERLEGQIKKLTALKSPKDDQKQLLQEFLSLQKTMLGGKNQSQSSIAGENKIILTSQSPDLLLSSQSQLQQSTVTPTGQQLTLQRKTITSPGPQSLPQSIQAHLQQLFPDTPQESEQSQPAQHTSMPSILPKITSTQQLTTTTTQQLNQPHSPSPATFNTLIKLNNSNSNSNNSTTTSGINQLHQVTQSQIVTASPQAQNVRILTPGTTSSIDGNTTIQVGTQLITIAPAPSAKTSSLQATPLHKQSSGGSTTIQVVRIGTPNASSSSTNSVNKLFKPPLESLQLESEKTKAKICRYFQQQAAADQSAAIRPDIKSPFKSRGDACKRLLRYHVFNTPVPSEEQLSKVDRDFEVISESLLKRKNELFNRFRYNLLKSNMIETPKAEYIMLNKWFINDENTSLQRDKDCVAQGKDLDLPPPPESWKKIIRDSIEEEERLSINRKRKSSAIEDDFLADCTEIKKYDLDDRESGDTDDDEEEDSEDDEDDEENTAAEDIAKYLGSNHHQDSVPDLGFYPDFNHTGMGLPTDVSSLTNPYTQRTNDNQDLLFNNDDWKGNNYMSTGSGNGRQFDGWGGRYDNENDVAVTTILGGGESVEGTDHDTDLDLSSIQDFHGLDKSSWQTHTPQQSAPTSTHPGQQQGPPGYGLENGGPDDQHQQQHQPNSHHDEDDEDDDDEGVDENEDDEDEDEDEDLTERANNGNLQIPCQLSGILDMPLPHQSPQSSQSYFNSIHSSSSSSGKSSTSQQQQQQQSTSSHSSPDTTHYGQQQLSPQSTGNQQNKSPLDTNQQQSASTLSTVYPNQMHQMMHQQQPPNHPTSPRSNNMLGDFRNSNQMMSDPIIDEAVRSILSWS